MLRQSAEMFGLDVLEHISANRIYTGRFWLASIPGDNVDFTRVKLIALAAFVIQGMQIKDCPPTNSNRVNRLMCLSSH
jgi:hypothetical protein